jgi:Fe-S oxidoreductase
MSGFFKLAQEVGKDRVDQALNTGASEILTSCPTCYLNLGRAARKENIKSATSRICWTRFSEHERGERV